MKIRMAYVVIMVMLMSMFINCATPQKKRLLSPDEPEPVRAADDMYEEPTPEKTIIAAAPAATNTPVPEATATPAPPKKSFFQKLFAKKEKKGVKKKEAKKQVKKEPEKKAEKQLKKQAEKAKKPAKQVGKGQFLLVAFIIFIALLILLFLIAMYFIKKMAKTIAMSKKFGDTVTYYRAGEEIAKWVYRPGGTVAKTGDVISGRIKSVCDESFGKKNYALVDYINNRIKDGAYNWYDEKTNVLKEEITYSDDLKHGPFRTFYASGSVKTEGDYQNGRINGIVKEFYEKGNLKGTWIFENYEVKEIYQYYPSEIILKEERKYRKGVLHGVLKEYFESRAVKSETPYVRGEIHGIARTYYENRVIREITKYVRGEEVQAKLYDENGKLIK